MCRFDFPGVTSSNNGIQFASVTIVDFYHDLGVKTMFIFVVYPLVNIQVEPTNKVILKGFKKKLDDSKGL